MEQKIDPTGLDAYKPAEVALRIEEAGVKKAALAAIPLLTLSVLAGAFIALGAAGFTAVLAGTTPGFGPARLLGGIVFSTGLILVVVAGAELFTGNTLVVMARVDGRVSTAALLRNWAYAFTGNLIGALSVALLMYLSGLLEGLKGDAARGIAEAKVALGPMEAFTRGILCNMLVCLAVWVSFAARGVADKIDREYVPDPHGLGAGGQCHDGLLPRQPGAGHARKYCGRRRWRRPHLLAGLQAKGLKRPR